MVQIPIRGCCQFQSAEADVIERLVVEREALVRVLDELVHRERRVVGLDDRVRHLGRRDHGVRRHDAVGVLLADLRDEERAHAGARAAAHGVDELEALEAVAGLGLLAHDVEDRVDELGAFRVVTFRFESGFPPIRVVTFRIGQCNDRCVFSWQHCTSVPLVPFCFRSGPVAKA